MERTPHRKTRLLHTGIRRTGRPGAFRYTSPGGRAVLDDAFLERVASLRIPPAWKRVRIAPAAEDALQAIGTDVKGRTQYLYAPEFRRRREEEKFLRLVAFGERLPRLRRKVHADLARKGLPKERVLAAAVRLLDRGFFRIGNDRSARDVETYGITTLRADHVRVRGENVRFTFSGKAGKEQDHTVSDTGVASVLREALRAGDEAFPGVSDRQVNAYIQAVIGDGYSAKDFRTWAGTLVCATELAREEVRTQKERKRRIREAILATSRALGNTPAVCRASYVCPRLLTEYAHGSSLVAFGRVSRARIVAKNGHSAAERGLLRFLRETIADRRTGRREGIAKRTTRVAASPSSGRMPR